MNNNKEEERKERVVALHAGRSGASILKRGKNFEDDGPTEGRKSRHRPPLS
jgi:hypothetical protein